MMKTIKTIEIDVGELITSEEMAIMFWYLGGDEQARFFNKLSEISGNDFAFQMNNIARSPELKMDVVHLFNIIGEYGV